jgi:putative ABC transport system substrate-binding protein
MKLDIGRRPLLFLLGGATATWLAPSHSQGAGRIRTIGFLMGLSDDNEAKVRIKAFEQGLKSLGWTPGNDIHIEYRFSAGDAGRMRAYARELVALKPDLIVGHSTPVVTQLFQATKTIPIVFVVVADPVGSGFVASIPRPGGNVTGFTNLAPTITGKLLTILKQITPNVSRVALLFSPEASISAGSLFLLPLEMAAPSFSVEVIRAQVHRLADVEFRMTELARAPNVGLIVMPDNFTTIHRQLIISLAARLRIPTVYPYRFFVDAGGLMSYGVDVNDLFHRAPEYVSRILRGEHPADLPVQAPTKFELVINLKTARVLGITIPRILLAGADALIK